MAQTTPLVFIVGFLVASAYAAFVEVPSLPAKAPEGEMYNPGVLDPNAGKVKTSWEMIGEHPVVGIHMGLYPGSDDWFLFLGRNRFSGVYTPGDSVAAWLDLPSRTFKNVSTESNTFCSSIVPTADGKLIIPGGHGKNTYSNLTDGKKDIRLYDKDKNPDALEILARMTYNRWYPTPTLRPDHKIVVHGGSLATNEVTRSAQYFELFDPENPTVQPLLKFEVENAYYEQAFSNFYPFDFILPTGDMFQQQDNMTRIIKPDGNYYKDPQSGSYQLTSGYPAGVRTQYPHMGTAAMLPLDPANNYSSVDIVIFGGTVNATCLYGLPDSAQLASRMSMRTTVTWDMDNNDNPVYKFSDWEIEDMGIPRSGGDSLLLPNGDVVIVSGGQTGCPGGSDSNGNRRNLYPAWWPVLYQPDKPKGERYTVMQGTGIVRMYHATAALTRDGYVHIAGCDQCGEDETNFSPYLTPGSTTAPEWYQPVTKGKNEFRHEIFKTPYSFDDANTPNITRVNDMTDDNGVVEAKYGDSLDIYWTNKVDGGDLVDVTSVSLVAPSAATHAFNNNQRVINLEITSNKKQDGKTGKLTVKLPENINVSPPQMYMLFIMNSKTFSRSRWVHLKDF